MKQLEVTIATIVYIFLSMMLLHPLQSLSAQQLSSAARYFPPADVSIVLEDAEDTVWTQTSLDSVSVSALTLGANGAVLAATIGDGIFRSTDDGLSWSQSHQNSGLSTMAIFTICRNDQNEIFAATDGDGIFRSRDNGDHWEPVNNGLQHFSVLSLAAGTGGLLYAGTAGGGIFRSNNSGDRWVSSNAGLTGTEVVFDIRFNGDGDLFAATNAHGVFFSVDSAFGWTLIGLQNVDVRTLTLTGADDLFAGAWFDGVHSYHRGSGSWSPSGLPNTHVMDLVVASNGEIFAATHGAGVHHSSDSGQNWQSFSGGIAGGVWSLAIDAGGHIYAGTSGSGVFKTLDAVPTAIADGPLTAPTAFTLEQNYPNPFNPVTTIGFTLTEAGRVTLDVFDISGRRIFRAYRDKPLPAGRHTLAWDGTSDAGQPAASGVYFYRLMVDDLSTGSPSTGSGSGNGRFAETRRMILLR